MTLRRQTLVATSMLGAALVAWIVTVDRMRGMDAGPGTDLGALGWYVGVWVTMMAAMMLPSAAPMVLVHVRAGRGSTVVFVAGYLLAWTVYGLAAYGVYRGVRAAAPSFLAWDRGGPWVAGGALIAAGLYQLTPLKTVCLGHCRSPLGFLLHDDEPGSPWRFVLYLDARADEEQRAALERVWTGAAGGGALKHFPWAWKQAERVAVRPVEIEVSHEPRRQWLRIRDRVSVRIRDAYAGPETVTCVIPGHEQSGEELVADELRVDDGPLRFELRGNCGYAARFDYGSDGA